jgi:hypothetical protein
MPSDPSQVPSVACLLYLAADQITPRGMSGTMLKATKVPCRPIWVQPIGLSATIAAATFLSLRDTGNLTLRLQEVTAKDPTYKMPPGRFRTHTTLTLTEAASTPQEGLGRYWLSPATCPTGFWEHSSPKVSWSTTSAFGTGPSPIPLSGTWSGPSCSMPATTRGPRGSASSRTANGSPVLTGRGPPRCAGGRNGKPPSLACALRWSPSARVRPSPSPAAVDHQLTAPN